MMVVEEKESWCRLNLEIKSRVGQRVGGQRVLHVILPTSKPSLNPLQSTANNTASSSIRTDCYL